MQQVPKLPKSKYYFKLFTSPEGKYILDYLKSETIQRLCLQPNTLLPPDIAVNPSEFIFLREGQNSVIWHIEEMIKLFENEKKE